MMSKGEGGGAGGGCCRRGASLCRKRGAAGGGECSGEEEGLGVRGRGRQEGERVCYWKLYSCWSCNSAWLLGYWPPSFPCLENGESNPP